MACFQLFKEKNYVKLRSFPPNIKQAAAEILAIISCSRVEEDPLHAVDMLNLALGSSFSDNPAFVLASLAHDLERALPCRLKAQSFPDYDSFKKAHALRSAEIAAKILEKHSLPPELISDTFFLIKHHESGLSSNPLVEELVYFDVLSFLQTNAQFFALREPFEKLTFRIAWGLKRLNTNQLNRLKKHLNIKTEPVKKAFFLALKEIG